MRGMKWWLGLSAGCAVLLLGLAAPSAQGKCAKGEKECNNRCVPKAQNCLKIKVANAGEGKDTDKDKLKGAPDKTDGSKSIEDKLKGDSGKAAPTAAVAASQPGTSSIAGCKSHAPLDDLRREGTEMLLRASGWSFGEPKVRDTEPYRIFVYEAKKDGEQAVVASYWYKKPASAQQLSNTLGGQKNVAAALGAGGQSVLAVILPKGGAKDKAKGFLEEVAGCQR